MQTVDNFDKQIADANTAKWLKLYPLWETFSKNQKKKIKRKWKEMNALNGCECDECNEFRLANKPAPTPTTASYWDLDIPVPKTTSPTPIYDQYKKNVARYEAQEKEKKMNAAYASAALIGGRDGALEARDYFYTRLDSIRRDKTTELKVQYGMTDDKTPKTPWELVDRIKAGMFILPKDGPADWSGSSYYSGYDYITWRDPSKTKDSEGYEKAEKLLTDAFNNAKDKLMASKAEDMLTVLEDFKSFK